MQLNLDYSSYSAAIKSGNNDFLSSTESTLKEMAYRMLSYFRQSTNDADQIIPGAAELITLGTMYAERGRDVMVLRGARRDDFEAILNSLSATVKGDFMVQDASNLTLAFSVSSLNDTSEDLTLHNEGIVWTPDRGDVVPMALVSAIYRNGILDGFNIADKDRWARCILRNSQLADHVSIDIAGRILSSAAINATLMQVWDRTLSLIAEGQFNVSDFTNWLETSVPTTSSSVSNLANSIIEAYNKSKVFGVIQYCKQYISVLSTASVSSSGALTFTDNSAVTPHDLGAGVCDFIGTVAQIAAGIVARIAGMIGALVAGATALIGWLGSLISLIPDTSIYCGYSADSTFSCFPNAPLQIDDVNASVLTSAVKDAIDEFGVAVFRGPGFVCFAGPSETDGKYRCEFHASYEAGVIDQLKANMQFKYKRSTTTYYYPACIFSFKSPYSSTFHAQLKNAYLTDVQNTIPIDWTSVADQSNVGEDIDYELKRRYIISSIYFALWAHYGFADPLYTPNNQYEYIFYVNPSDGDLSYTGSVRHWNGWGILESLLALDRSKGDMYEWSELISGTHYEFDTRKNNVTNGFHSWYFYLVTTLDWHYAGDVGFTKPYYLGGSTEYNAVDDLADTQEAIAAFLTEYWDGVSNALLLPVTQVNLKGNVYSQLSSGLMSALMDAYVTPLPVSYDYTITLPTFTRSSLIRDAVTTALVTTAVVAVSVITAFKIRKRIQTRRAALTAQVESLWNQYTDPETGGNIDTYNAYRKAVRKNNIYAKIFGGTKYSKEGYWVEAESTGLDACSSMMELPDSDKISIIYQSITNRSDFES